MDQNLISLFEQQVLHGNQTIRSFFEHNNVPSADQDKLCRMFRSKSSKLEKRPISSPRADAIVAEADAILALLKL